MFGLIAQNGVLFVYVIGMCMVIKISGIVLMTQRYCIVTFDVLIFIPLIIDRKC